MKYTFKLIILSSILVLMLSACADIRPSFYIDQPDQNRVTIPHVDKIVINGNESIDVYTHQSGNSDDKKVSYVFGNWSVVSPYKMILADSEGKRIANVVAGNGTICGLNSKTCKDYGAWFLSDKNEPIYTESGSTLTIVP